MIFAAEGAHGVATPLSLILIAAGAFVIPLLARRIRLPAVVAEILFGVVAGPILGVIEPGEELITFLAELGLFLLMFLAGIEIDFDRLQRQGPSQLMWGLAVLALIVVAAWVGSGFVDTESTDQRVFLTLLISAAALGLVVPTLRAGGRLASPIGQMTLLIAIFAEVASVIGIITFVIFFEKGFHWDLAAVPLLFFIIGASLVMLSRAAWWYPEWFSRLFSQNDPEELGIRASLALMFVFVGLSALLGIEAILGAFLAGLIFSFVFRDLGSLEEQLNGFSYGFFIPIFFINVGLTFPLDELRDSDVLKQAVALIAVAIAVKVVPALILMLRGFSLRQSLGVGFLLAGQLSVIIALADVGLDLGLISSGLRAGAILLVAVSAIFGPVAFRLLVPAPEEAAAA
jgi:Kef-type K+ transport system membrane component KefB